MIIDKIKQDKKLLEKQLFWVETSFNECKNIGIKSEYSVEEFGKFETLCSRYSRGIDFLIRKLFRSIDEYEFENQGTLIDVVNNAHKKGLFEDIEDKLVYIFDEVLEYTGKLIIIIKNTLIYINEKWLINVK